MKHTITLKFNKVPKHCGECPLYINNAYEEDKSWFGDGITHSCPFGGDTFGCLVERPKNCPIGSIIEVNEKDKSVNSPYNIDIKLFEKSVKDSNLLSTFFEEADLTHNEYVDKVNFPQTFEDLKFIAFLCHYKTGWAYYEAKKLNIEIPVSYKRRYHVDGTVSYSRRRSWGSYYDDADYNDYDFGISPWGDS